MRIASDLQPCAEFNNESARHPFAWRASRLSAGMLAILLSGCSPAAPLNFLAWRHGIEITRSVAYGEGTRRTLDIYRPRNAAAAPVIVFFYGGSWQSGNKATYLFVAAALARRGYVTVVPDYRVYPEVRYPVPCGGRKTTRPVSAATRKSSL